MLVPRAIIVVMLLSAHLLAHASVPTTTSVGAPVPTYGIGEQIVLGSGADSTSTPPAAELYPTGTVYFTVNGVPVGTPFPIQPSTMQGVSLGQGVVSFTTPGMYPVFSHYSGDTVYAPSDSTSSIVLDIVAAPVRFGFLPATSSLSFTSGSQSNNTDAVVIVPLNGFYGNEDYGCSVAESATEPAAFYPPSCQMTSANFANGTNGFILSITTQPAKVVTASRKPDVGSPWAYAGLMCFGLLWTTRRSGSAASAALATCAFGFLLIGCGGGTPVQTKTESSAGHYVVHLTGDGYDFATGQRTLARPSDIALTVN